MEGKISNMLKLGILPTFSRHQLPSLNTQSCNSRPLCSTLKLENLSIKLFKIHKQISKIFFWFFITLPYVTFLCRRYNFLFLKTWKKHPQKLLIIGPELFFQYWPSCPNGPKTEILYHQKPLNARLGI